MDNPQAEQKPLTAEDWLRTYYPVTAHALAADGDASDVDLVEHALRKWRGMRPEVLKAHGLTTGVTFDLYDLHKAEPDQLVLNIDSSSCGLCHKYFTLAADPPCHQCILTRVRGKSCAHHAESDKEYKEYSPWGYWTRRADPEPMIQLLEQALERAKQEAADQHAV
jgi:hypothetical protein